MPKTTYALAKKLNDILTPFVPKDYALPSTQDFLELLKASPAAENHVTVVFDVESLLINVPVDRMI